MKRSLMYSIALTLVVVISSIGQVFATKHIINVQNFSFSPSSITNVVVGDTIRWVWVSGSHTTTSTTIPASATTWDEPLNSGNTSFEYKVTLAGTYHYQCTPHVAMGMVGSFVASAQTATLSIQPSNRNVSDAAGSTTFAVTSNSSWTTSSNASWCTATVSGTGNATITANYTANLSVNQRIATITVTVAGIPSQVVTVTQAGATATLVVAPPNQNVSYTAGSAIFNVTSNTSWTASSDSEWCTVTPSGTGNGTLSAAYTENTSKAVRIATISLNVDGLTPQIVTVTQDLSSVSVNEIAAGTFSIYPNPAQGNFTIIPGELSGNTFEISVIDLYGKIVFTQKRNRSENYSVDLQYLPSGSYTVRFASNKGINDCKLVLIN